MRQTRFQGFIRADRILPASLEVNRSGLRRRLETEWDRKVWPSSGLLPATVELDIGEPTPFETRQREGACGSTPAATAIVWSVGRAVRRWP